MRLLTEFEMMLVAGGTTTTEDNIPPGDDGPPIEVIGNPGDDDPWGDGGGYGGGNDDNPDGDWGGGGGGQGGEPPAPPPGIPVEIAKIIADLITKLPSDLYTQAEIALRNLTYYEQGGYDHEPVTPDHLDTVTTLNDVTIYQQLESGNLYADRDGDGSVDTGIWYNELTGIVALDKDADGQPDQVLGDVTP